MKPSQPDLQAKKWFVYLGDKHEGPFSALEVQAKITGGQLTLKSFVWCEGMSDWKAMSDVQELVLEVQAASTVATAEPDKTKDLDPKDLKQAKAPEKSRLRFALKISPFTWILVGLILLVAAGTALVAPLLTSGQPIDLSRLTEAVPFLSQWISPLPPIDDIKPEALEELKAAARRPLLKEGPSVALVLAEGDPTTPSLYLATNLPEGAEFDLFIEGVGDTLLNQTSYLAKAKVITGKKLGKSRPLKQADGKPLARGEYLISLVESETNPQNVKDILSNKSALPYPAGVPVARLTPPGRKLFLGKKFFLGGARDATYTSRLKEFHDKLISKANSEIVEIKQFASTLESQLQKTNETYELLKKGNKLTPVQIKKWSEFHAQWTQLQGQLITASSPWSGDSLASDYFYGVLYGYLKESAGALEKIHALQGLLFVKPLDAKKLPLEIAQRESEIAEPLRQTLDRLSKLKIQLEALEKNPPAPGRLPVRMENAS